MLDQPAKPTRREARQATRSSLANPTYRLDPAIKRIFANPLHGLTFSRVMLSNRGLRLVSLSRQKFLAREVEATIEAYEVKVGRSLRSDAVEALIQHRLTGLEIRTASKPARGARTAPTSY